MNICLITDLILDKLGFTPYQDGAGDYGHRTLAYPNKPPYNKSNMYEIICYDEKDDANDGYGEQPEYGDGHYASGNNYSSMYFIHELYDDVRLTMSTEFFNYFIEQLKKNNLFPYIESYLNHCKDIRWIAEIAKTKFFNNMQIQELAMHVNLGVAPRANTITILTTIMETAIEIIKINKIKFCIDTLESILDQTSSEYQVYKTREQRAIIDKINSLKLKLNETSSVNI